MRRKESWESFDPASAVRQRGTCYCLDTRVDELLKRRIACAGRAATFVAAKAACIHGWLACAFVRLRRPKAPLRVTFDRSSPPSMPHYHAAWRGASSLLSMPVSLAPLGNGHGPCGAAIRSASMLANARASGG